MMSNLTKFVKCTREMRIPRMHEGEQLCSVPSELGRCAFRGVDCLLAGIVAIFFHER